MTRKCMILALACLLVVLGISTALAATPDRPMMGQSNPCMREAPPQDQMMGPHQPGQGMGMGMGMMMMSERHICPMVVMGMDKVLKTAPDQAYYRVGVEDLKTIVDSQTPGVLVLDVRPQSMYAAGHIPGSLNIPMPMLVDHLSLIHPDTVVYVVCAADTNAAFAAFALRMMDYDAYVVPGGVPEWQKHGYPMTMEVGPVQMPQMQHAAH
ncbi:MAG: Rhodanese-like domain protein [Firmicutes bacterium]|nr:Rhodanese-like domain protein [Bacillota bacterium]